MPRKEAILLSDLTGDVVWLVCDKCGRKGRGVSAHLRQLAQFRGTSLKAPRLIEKHGADKKLAYLRTEMADCPKAYTESTKNIYDLCGARWRLADRGGPAPGDDGAGP